VALALVTTLAVMTTLVSITTASPAVINRDENTAR
jgi:hypothetical protein